MTGMLLEARDLDTYYGASHILRGVSLSIAPGETVGLMGRNGMGKTTLIRTVMGLVRPRAGTVSVAGKDVTGMPTFAIARMGVAYVPEGRGILASLSVLENLEIAARPGPGGAVDWSLERVLDLFPRLAERRRNRGDQLSGGEQQMLAIGRALLTNPRLLILDEATEGLAPLIRDEIWRIVRSVRAAGIAVLVVDKSVAEITALADRVAVLVKGVVVMDGPPQALLADEAAMHRMLGV
ncbi:MAG: ABC transporter ATP-binding protein [Hyphomicrobiaceae bacterium]